MNFTFNRKYTNITIKKYTNLRFVSESVSEAISFQLSLFSWSIWWASAYSSRGLSSLAINTVYVLQSLHVR